MSRRAGIGPFLAACAVVSLVASPVALAHHSFAMFDSQHRVTISGIATEYAFKNPHVFITVNVQNPKTGDTEEWVIEGPASGSLSRSGWTRDSIKVGDKLEVIVNPLRDGEPGGALLEVKLPTGQVLKR